FLGVTVSHLFRTDTELSWPVGTMALDERRRRVTFDPFDRWLPQEDDMSRGFRRRLPLRRLFREPHHGDRKLDQDDPYASPTAFRTSMPARVALKLLSLQVADSIGRVWRNSSSADVF